jgi:hypothetical protein
MRTWLRKGRMMVPAAVVAALVLGIGATRAGSTVSGPVSPPFTQCPPVGSAPSCSLLIVLGTQGTTVLADPSAGPIAGDDDYLVGVQNNSTVTLSGVQLTRDDIFKFEVEADGICAHITCTWPAPIGDEGPNTRFEITDYSHGIVHFPAGLAPGASTYFDLEQAGITYAAAAVTFGKTAVVDSSVGDVCYYKAGTASGSNGCIPVTAETAVGIGSVLDTTRGRAKLNTAEGTSTATGATFKLQEQRVRGVRYTLLKLVKPKLSGCRTTARHTAGLASTQKKKKSVSLWVHAKGHFKTQGQYASATVRGTTWLTQERCDGTLIRVLRGVVDVHDLVRGKTYNVKAGHAYLARKP